MNARSLVAGLTVAATAYAPLASATTDSEIQQLRDEMAALRSDYEARIGALETRLAAAQATVEQSTPVEPAPFVQPPLATSELRQFGQRIQSGRVADSHRHVRSAIARIRPTTRSAASFRPTATSGRRVAASSSANRN